MPLEPFAPRTSSDMVRTSLRVFFHTRKRKGFLSEVAPWAAEKEGRRNEIPVKSSDLLAWVP